VRQDGKVLKSLLVSWGMSPDPLSINAIRVLAIDAVQQANSGHPGLPLDAAPMAYVLWTRFMRHNPSDPHWPDRDRFVLSAGHGSALLYSLLYLTGYDLSIDQLKRFRQWGSLTPGHPEYGETPGVDATTGPLGQGFANGVGMAIAEAHLAAVYNRPGHTLFNHYTYGIVSDGDLMEGLSAEAASLAGHLGLGKLIYFYDDNSVSLSGATSLSFSEDVPARFRAYGWHVTTVSDGNDLATIEEALNEARAEAERPSLIVVRTTIGFGSPNKAGTFEVHGSPLGPDEVKATRKALGWPLDEPFVVPDEALADLRQAVDRGRQWQAEWDQRKQAYAAEFPELHAQLERALAGDLLDGWDADLPMFKSEDAPVATRVASGQVVNAIAARLPELIGGSADLNPSTNTALKGSGDFQPTFAPDGDRQGAVGGGWGYAGRNLHFGVREHAMGAIVNGIAYHGGLIPFSATFLTFSDYMRAPIRLASMSHLGSIFVFTHDSIGLGEDGPTHQPVEHLASLRAIPDLVVLRPGDANESREAWRIAIQRRHAPTVLIFTRQALPILDRSKLGSERGTERGAYVLADPSNRDPELILIGTGSEVSLAYEAWQKLTNEGIRARLVSMPSWELFEQQSQAYRDEVLPPRIRARLAVEAGVPQGWARWVGDGGDTVTLDRFGASAPYKVVFEHLGFTVDNVVGKAKALLKR
jgi:transketolase